MTEKPATGSDLHPFRIAAIASVAILAYLIGIVGPASAGAETETISINGTERVVAPYASAQSFLDRRSADWPAGDLIDVDGRVLEAGAIAPIISIDGQPADLETPIPPHAAVSLSRPSDQREATETRVENFGFDAGPLVWHTVWKKGRPGEISTTRGIRSGLPVSQEIITAPVPAANLVGTSLAALTFDDGPNHTWTPIVLDILREKGVKATFFVVGSRVSGAADMIERAVAEGHSVQNHSWSHRAGFDTVTIDEALSEISDTTRAITNATGHRPTFFRPPGGGLNEAVETICRQSGLQIAMWNDDPQDWRGKESNEIFSHVTTANGGGDIILLHDGGGDRGQTTAALPAIIDDLRAKGYEFVTLG